MSKKGYSSINKIILFLKIFIPVKIKLKGIRKEINPKD